MENYNYYYQRGPGSVPDHPEAPLLPPSSASSTASYSYYGSSYGVEEDPLPPPPQWMLQPPLPPPPPPFVQRPFNVVLPPFRPSRPSAWFAAVEDVFQLRGVTDQRDMFAYCYAALGEDQLLQVDDLIELRPRPLDAFYRLRDRLVATHSLDAYQRLEQLMALPPLGGQKPSVLLAQMRQLCPPGEDNTMIFRAAFLQRLPSSIRMQLAEDRFSPVQALAARADALVVHHSYQVAAAAVEEPGDVAAAVQGSRQPWKKKGKAPHSGRGAAGGAAKGEKPWDKLGICRLHYRYGADAIGCAAPCAWSTGN